GLDFLNELERRRQPPLRAVILTGETSSQFIAHISNLPWAVLHKPVNYVRLATCLQSGSA
ncbi:MAG TPA: hypothetical protein VFW59_08235, partial [Gallionella sp.]|nr:hypothetical protein [Gallionella sp.]